MTINEKYKYVDNPSLLRSKHIEPERLSPSKRDVEKVLHHLMAHGIITTEEQMSLLQQAYMITK
ncbi:hypothetical protein GA-1p40 [Bacillus phage GA1]|uniref:Uncharacterized protein n=1 Tax=Bacillus phage GA-1 TaxID=2679898 RepID=Q9FZV8_BPGA1|nr:hypothetical protein GA-1p40 [Bacillus phage GA1]CAC21538.1 hypothetical protein [Bacillus phage GA1]